LQASEVLEEQMTLLMAHERRVREEHAYWMSVLEELKDDSAGEPLKNLHQFFAETQFEETLRQIKEDWEATKHKCEDQARWFQAGAATIKETNFLRIIHKVCPVACALLGSR
jgi:hypothetical protein